MPLNAILIEDSLDDALLLEGALVADGIDVAFARVETRVELEVLLDRDQDWSFIISDYVLPRFSVAEALMVVRERGLDIPFLVVSGRYGEEAAVETMRAGAQDYVPKDRLVRLAPAVRRELREASWRQERRELEGHLGFSDPLFLFGRLASSLAHELNNPLTLMHAGLGVLSQRMAALNGRVEVETLRGMGSVLDKLAVGTERVAEIAADFRALGSTADEPSQRFEVNPLVRHCVKLVQLEFRRRAGLRFVEGPVTFAEIKPGRLMQALVGLLLYAAHSFPWRAEAGDDGRAVIIRTTPYDEGHFAIDLCRCHPAAAAGEGVAAGPVGARRGVFDYGRLMGERNLKMLGGRLVCPKAGTDPGATQERLTIVLPLRWPV